MYTSSGCRSLLHVYGAFDLRLVLVDADWQPLWTVSGPQRLQTPDASLADMADGEPVEANAAMLVCSSRA